MNQLSNDFKACAKQMHGLFLRFAILRHGVDMFIKPLVISFDVGFFYQTSTSPSITPDNPHSSAFFRLFQGI